MSRRDPLWRERAACQTADPEEFFGEDGKRGDETLRAVRARRAWCDRCPVMADCLSHGLDQGRTGEEYGVFGGTTRGERLQLRRFLAASREVDARRVFWIVSGHASADRAPLRDVVEAVAAMTRLGSSVKTIAGHLRIPVHNVRVALTLDRLIAARAEQDDEQEDLTA